MPKHKLAAGGLVERATSEGLRLAVVRRTRYGDWVLPKGKPDGNETLEETALREVREETGCQARIVGPGHTIEYLVGRVPKIVTFYRMEYIADGYPVDAGEIRDVVWLAPRDAHERLTYGTERDVVKRVYARGEAAN